MTAEQLRLGTYYSDRIKDLTTELKKLRKMRKSGHIDFSIRHEGGDELELRYNFLYLDPDTLFDKYEKCLEDAIAEAQKSLDKL